MLIGNGGSAAIVSHVQNDLCKQAGIRALVFTEPPLLTALGNDCGYDSVFELPVELWASSGDLLIAVSSSGRSENILRAVHAATLQGCQIVTLSGFQADNPLRCMGDVNFYVPAHTYGFVESAHMALAHCLIDHVVAGCKTDRIGE
jgi:D-sedoheptulose 7-phosphate isomerase